MNPTQPRLISGIHITLVYTNGDSHTWSASLAGAPAPLIQDLVDNAIDERLMNAGYIRSTRMQKRESLRKFKEQNGGAE